jgi:hypothetical protein
MGLDLSQDIERLAIGNIVRITRRVVLRDRSLSRDLADTESLANSFQQTDFRTAYGQDQLPILSAMNPR